MELSELDILIYECVAQGPPHRGRQRIITMSAVNQNKYKAYFNHEKPIGDLKITEGEVRKACNRLERAGLFHRNGNRNKDIFYVSTPVQIVKFKKDRYI